MNHSRKPNHEPQACATYSECLLAVISGIWFGLGLLPLFCLVPIRMVGFLLSPGLGLNDYLLLLCGISLFGFFSWLVGISTWEFYKKDGLARKSPQLPTKRVFLRTQAKGWAIFSALLAWVLLMKHGASATEAALDVTGIESFVFRSFLIYSPTMMMFALALSLFVDFRKGSRSICENA